MIFNLRSSVGRRSGAITEDSFEFGGSYDFFRDDESGNWELVLWESGTLSWLKDPGMVDLCVVGAGEDGGDAFFSGGGSGNWEYNDSFINSGKGGDGGRVYSNTQGVSLESELTVVVGESDGEASSISVYSSANGPAPKTGGSGATMRQATNAVGTLNKGGADGVYAYGADSDETIVPALSGKRLGASGGAGYANNNIYVWSDLRQEASNKGGATGAGDGGIRDHHAGYDATGIGTGGGGGYGDGKTHDLGKGGKGSSGAIIMRNHKEA